MCKSQFPLWNCGNFTHETTHDKYFLIRSKFVNRLQHRGQSKDLERQRVFNKNTSVPVPADYYSVFTQKLYFVISYTLMTGSVQTEIHNLHGKCICCCGYLDKHTRLNFYLYEAPKPNICQGIIVGDKSVAHWHSKKHVHFPNAISLAGRCL